MTVVLHERVRCPRCGGRGARELSFGDGVADQPFSIVALATPDAITNEMDLLAKWDETTGSQLREWRAFSTSTNGYPQFEMYDESANAYIGRADQTSLSTNTWALLAFTYDGSGASTGVRIYKDAARVDAADAASGTYTAMEDTASVASLAHKLGTGGAAAGFWDGKMGLVALTAKELVQEEVWAIKTLVNSYFGLSL